MKERVIRVYKDKEPELYEELVSAVMNHTQYDGCYVMQYMEHPGENLQTVAEFTLREQSGAIH
ncbi:MAG: hypothetical protein JRJ14_04200 [Deltaproteobacteria bacterium]|nr:hypothetical protein [Deltaproteobacteria bacterium]